MRDELVRAVMPELHVLLQHSVNAAVEHAILPLIDRQRELESELKELRAIIHQAPPQGVTAAPHREAATYPVGAAAPAMIREAVAPAMVREAVAPAMVREAVAPAMVREAVAQPVTSQRVSESKPDLTGERLVPRAQASLESAARDLELLDEIPAELNGSRRKKVLLAGFVTLLMLLLLSAAGASLASNLGLHF